MVAEGDRVAVRYTARATHQGPFQGIAPTNKPVTIMGMSILRVADGKIAEEWAMPDFSSLMQQLSTVSMPGQAGS